MILECSYSLFINSFSGLMQAEQVVELAQYIS